MPRFTRWYALLAAMALALGACAAMSGSASATPAEIIAHPDGVDFADVPDVKKFTVYQGESRDIYPLNNDVFPADANVQLAWYEQLDPTIGFVERLGDTALWVTIYPGVLPENGVVELDYAISEGEQLVKSTITVTVQQVRPVKVRKHRNTDGKVVPGKLVAINPAGNTRAHCLFGTYRLPEPDGVVHVPSGTRKVFSVKRKEIDWECYVGPRWVYASSGHVSNIPRPRTTTSRTMEAPTPTERMLKLWVAPNK